MGYSEFKQYYKSCLNLSDEDFAKFTDCIETPLPSTFRITPTNDSAQIRDFIEQVPFVDKIPALKDVYSFPLKSKLKSLDDTDDAPETHAADHYNKAYFQRMAENKQKFTEEEYRAFIEFLVPQTDNGNIQRQEFVSMLPHLFLDVKSDSRILETCASPGSKTKQLLEIVGRSGLLVSNDKSTCRIAILISESFKKASESFVATKMDATRFPSTTSKFDRICCDVPCTSDGTIRKNPVIFSNWNIKNAVGISSIQKSILKKSLELLADGGRIVYSTCSLNPIENENVVNSVIADGKYMLVDDFSFVTKCGSSTSSASSESRIKIREGITKFEYENIKYENPELSKCIRILPQDQNTGGFFIAVIQRRAQDATVKKTEETPARSSEEVYELLEKQSLYLVPEELTQKLHNRFGIKETNNILISRTKKMKNIYSVNPLVLDFIISNPKVSIAAAGIKAFSLTDIGDCEYRAKGAYLCANAVETDVTGTKEDLKLLVADTSVPIAKLSFSSLLDTKNKHFTVRIAGTNNYYSGFKGTSEVFLYIDNVARKGLKRLLGI
ncbi:tRNA (cytosine34-C5)-methyltransferase [Enteropsectra breve]|nr:tRNA (cytosine34-C5)-methyltransferase [Enteropsectra breve]